MRMFAAITMIALSSLGGQIFSQAPESPPPSTSSDPVSIQDMDYQIELCKQYIAEYKNQAFLFDEKAQSLLSHDFTGYRDAEAMSQRAQAIADDLTGHLKELEKKREEMVQRQAKGQKPPQK